MSAKTWKYVLNNYTEKDIEFLKLLDCKRHRCGKEVGESGTPHLQGAITFCRTYRAAALKKLHDKIHWEVALCSDFNYEAKGENIIEINNSRQGKRTDLEDVAKLIDEGKSLKEIANSDPSTFIKCYKGIERYKSLKETKRNWEMEVHILWGRPGTGKTRQVWDKHGIDNVYVKMKNKWWDHYDGEEVVLIDDFDPQHTHECTFDYWLTLFDRYPMIVEYKGGSTQFRSKIIYITSNFNPEFWFNERSNRDAFFRRVVTVTEVSGR